MRFSAEKIVYFLLLDRSGNFQATSYINRADRIQRAVKNARDQDLVLPLSCPNIGNNGAFRRSSCCLLQICVPLRRFFLGQRINQDRSGLTKLAFQLGFDLGDLLSRNLTTHLADELGRSSNKVDVETRVLDGW